MDEPNKGYTKRPNLATTTNTNVGSTVFNYKKRGIYANEVHKSNGVSSSNAFSQPARPDTNSYMYKRYQEIKSKRLGGTNNTISNELQDHYRKLGEYYKKKYGV